jgi:hypothetical protein
MTSMYLYRMHGVVRFKLLVSAILITALKEHVHQSSEWQLTRPSLLLKEHAKGPEHCTNFQYGRWES